MRLLFLFNRWRRIVQVRIGNELKEGFWVTIAGRRRFISLDKVFRQEYPKQPKVLESRVKYWLKRLKTPSDLEQKATTIILGKEVPCIPAFKELRSYYPTYVVRKADKLFGWWWAGRENLAATRKFLNQKFTLDPLTHSYFCDLWSLTQALYRKTHPSGQITLYRSVDSERALKVLQQLLKGSGLRTFELSVFTESRTLARIHSIAGSEYRALKEKGAGFVVRKRVPISDIFFSWRVAGKGVGQEVLVKQQVITKRDVVVPKFVEMYPKGVAKVPTEYGEMNLSFFSHTGTMEKYLTRLERRKLLKKIPRNQLLWKDIMDYTDYVVLHNESSLFLIPKRYFNVVLKNKGWLDKKIPSEITRDDLDFFFYFVPVEKIEPLIGAKELGKPFLSEVKHCYLCFPDPDVLPLDDLLKAVSRPAKQYARVGRRRKIYFRS